MREVNSLDVSPYDTRSFPTLSPCRLGPHFLADKRCIDANQAYI